MYAHWILAAILCSSSLVASAASPARPTAAEVQRELTATYFHWFPEMATFYSVDPTVAGPGSGTRPSPRTQADEVAKRATFKRVLTRFGEVDVPGLWRSGHRPMPSWRPSPSTAAKPLAVGSPTRRDGVQRGDLQTLGRRDQGRVRILKKSLILLKDRLKAFTNC